MEEQDFREEKSEMKGLNLNGQRGGMTRKRQREGDRVPVGNLGRGKRCGRHRVKMRVRDGLSDGRRDEQGVAAERGEGGELEMAHKGSSRGEGDERKGDGSTAILRQRR